MSIRRFVRPAACLALCAALLSGCTVLKVDNNGSGFESDVFITGHLAAGWPDDQAIIELDVFHGHNDGAFFWFNIWNLFRVEVGLIGFSVGVGPLDAGLGILFYEAYPPHYSTNWFGVHGGDGDHDDDGCEECEDCDDD